MMFTSLLRGRSVTVHSRAEKEKGPRSEISRRDLSVCLCISIEALFCEDESQKDFFEREDEYNEANTGPLKSQERFFLNKTSLFCVSETFGARKGISGNAQHHVHHNIFLSFTLALLILSRRSDEKRAKSREEQKRETRAIARARVQLAERKEREREKVHVGFLLPFFFFSSLRVLLWLTFSLFFAQIWVHKLKLSRVSRKERFLRDIKFKLWNNKR